MRNPFKRYYFLRFERTNEEGVTVCNHFMMFSEWFWVKPAEIFRKAEAELCEKVKCKPEDLFLTVFNKN